jgi:hypothetical protein
VLGFEPSSGTIEGERDLRVRPSMRHIASPTARLEKVAARETWVGVGGVVGFIRVACVVAVYITCNR